MYYRKIFDEFEQIKVHDELAKFLGVNDDGVFEFSYIDVVKNAGHSCPTVAGAYIMALEGLKKLYPNELPKRGKIKVELKNEARVKNSGVVGSVLAQITGASTDNGFGGIPSGKYNRRDTLIFGADIQADVRFTRLDTNKSILVSCYSEKVINPMVVLQSAISPDATQENKKSFPDRFQDLVHTLFNSIDEVVEIKEEVSTDTNCKN